MSPDLSGFKLDVGNISPRYWHLHALYESPLVIAAHLSCDTAEFFVSDDARESLLTWLSKIEQTARFVGGARPVVACLQVEDEPHFELMVRWENEANWRGSGYVLYIEKSAREIQIRLEQLLFRSISEVHFDPGDLASAIDPIAGMLDEFSNVSSQALAKGIHDVIARRSQGDSQDSLKAEVAILAKEWQIDPVVQPSVVAANSARPDNASRLAEVSPLLDEVVPGRRGRLDRLVNVQISSFRGWCKAHELNVDADLVLLTGPNGHGKSTFLESLILGICGHAPRSGDEVRPRGVNDTKSSVAYVRLELPKGDPLSVELPFQAGGGDEEEEFPRPLLPGLARSGLWHDFYKAVGDAGSASRAEASLCSVFSDQLYERFDYKRSADNLLSAFSRVGAQLAAVREVLEAVRKDLDPGIQDFAARVARIRENEAVARAALLEAFEIARPIYHVFVELYSDYEPGKSLPRWPDLPTSETERLGSVQVALNELVRALGVDVATLPSTIQEMIDHWKSRMPDVQQGLHLDELVRRYERLKAHYPEARLRVEAFAGGDGGPPLDVCLESLARNLDSWRRASLRFDLTVVAEQLGRVIPDDLQRLSQFMTQHVSHWRNAAQEMDRLEGEIENARRHFQETERFRKLRAVETSPELAMLWRALQEGKIFESSDALILQLEEQKRRTDEARQALDEVIGKLDPLRLHPTLQKVFQEVLNDVLGRIQLSPGILPVRVDADGHIFMSDGRTISDLSTGQRTQLAVALSVGVNLALSSHLGNSVLVMDDATAAYDVSNIAREATFWRAAAYGHLARGDSSGSDLRRRQVFLSSHNEATTRRLIEHLRPPKGATMKVVRFTNWSPDAGPEYRIVDVCCTAPSCMETRRRLSSEIRESLGRDQ